MVAIRMQLCEIRKEPSAAARRQPIWVWAYRFPGGFEFVTPQGQRLRVRESQLELAMHKAALELTAA